MQINLQHISKYVIPYFGSPFYKFAKKMFYTTIAAETIATAILTQAAATTATQSSTTDDLLYYLDPYSFNNYLRTVIEFESESDNDNINNNNKSNSSITKHSSSAWILWPYWPKSIVFHE